MGQARCLAALTKTVLAQSKQVTSDGKFHKSKWVYSWLLVASQMSGRAGCSWFAVSLGWQSPDFWADCDLGLQPETQKRCSCPRWHAEHWGAFADTKTGEPTKSSRTVWLLLILFVLSTLSYLFAHWETLCIDYADIDSRAGIFFFFFFFFSHLRWESGLWFISHNLSQSDSLKNKEKEKNQTVLMHFHQKRTGWRRTFGRESRMREPCLIPFHHFSLSDKIWPSPHNYTSSDTQNAPKNLLAGDKPPYQKWQHETNAIRRRNNKWHTMLSPTPMERWLLDWKVTDYYGELSIFIIAINNLNAKVRQH